ncbi:hypothetical protein R50072_28280 [Simiduia litorea]
MNKNLIIAGICTLLITLVVFGAQITLFNSTVNPVEVIASEAQECISDDQCEVFWPTCNGCSCELHAISSENISKYSELKAGHCKAETNNRICEVTCLHREAVCQMGKCKIVSKSL